MNKDTEVDYRVFSTGKIRRVYCPSNFVFSGFEGCPSLKIVKGLDKFIQPRAVCKRTNRTCPQVVVSEKNK